MQGEASTRLGFTDYFRVELAWAKLLGAVLLLAPVPARLKEWAYAAFAITLGSAGPSRTSGSNTSHAAGAPLSGCLGADSGCVSGDSTLPIAVTAKLVMTRLWLLTLPNSPSACFDPSWSCSDFDCSHKVRSPWRSINAARASPRDEHRCRRGTAAGTHVVKLN